MTDIAQDKTTVTVTLDGKEIEAEPGEMIIAAAERHGVYIPRFCYHPRMRSVGMCRMCLVDVKGPRGFALTPACFVAVAEGQEVVTDSPRVKKAQDGVLEFLLVNHPLDCPVCDKGGECPLQDQTSRSVRARRASSRRSGTSRSPSPFPTSCTSTASVASSATGAPASPTRWPATR